MISMIEPRKIGDFKGFWNGFEWILMDLEWTLMDLNGFEWI